MTAPRLPLKPPRDFENITTRECFSAVQTGENGGPTPGGAPPIRPVTVALPILDGGWRVSLFRQPSAQTDYGWHEPWYDATGQNQVRVICDVRAAGASTAKIVLEYSADGATGWTAPSASAVTVSIASTGRKKSAWFTLATGAARDVVWRAQPLGGDATVTPIIGKVHAQFRQATATPPVRGLPTGRVPIWDLDARAIPPEDIEDGLVIRVIDQTGNGHDGTGGLLGPSYEPDGFGPGIPAWYTFSHASGLGITDGIPAIDSCSYYVAFKYLTSNLLDSPIFESNAGPPNISFGIAPDGSPYAYVWTTIFPTIIAGDDPLVPGTLYVLALMFDRQLGRFWFTVNNALVPAHNVNPFAPPGLQNTGPTTVAGYEGLSVNDCNPQLLDDSYAMTFGYGSDLKHAVALFGRALCYAGPDTPALSAPVVAALLAQFGGE